MDETDLPLVVVPGSAEHLNELVVDTVVARWGGPPIERGPGAYAMRFSTVDVLITTEFDPPLVEISGPLVTDIADEEHALFNLNLLNKTFLPHTFTLVDRTLVAKAYIHAMPFVPDHLLIALSSLTDISRGLGEQLAEKFGGKTTS